MLERLISRHPSPHPEYGAPQKLISPYISSQQVMLFQIILCTHSRASLKVPPRTINFKDQKAESLPPYCKIEPEMHGGVEEKEKSRN